MQIRSTLLLILRGIMKRACATNEPWCGWWGGGAEGPQRHSSSSCAVEPAVLVLTRAALLACAFKRHRAPDQREHAENFIYHLCWGDRSTSAYIVERFPHASAEAQNYRTEKQNLAILFINMSVAAAAAAAVDVRPICRSWAEIR